MMRKISKGLCLLALSVLICAMVCGCMRDGLSAYEIAVSNGYTGSEAEWLATLAGKDGKNGKDGKDGLDGEDGKSAYQLACEAGFVGTVGDWISSLSGKDGADGRSAYEVAVNNGYTGSEAEWITELMGSRQESGTGSGVGISSVVVNAEKHLIVHLTNGTVIDAGYVGISESGQQGEAGGERIDGDGYTVVNQTVTVITGALNIRSTPDSSSSGNVVDSLVQGTELIRVGIGRDGNTWSKVVYGGQICYASSRFLEVKYDAEVDLTGVEIPRVNLSDKYYLTVGVETCFEVDQLVVGLEGGMYPSFEYNGSGKKAVSSDSIAITPTAAENATLRFNIKKYVDGHLTVIYSKTATLISVAPADVDVKLLAVGDSRIAEGAFIDELQSRLGSSLTLMGTRKTSSGKAHEGRTSWSTSNYLSYSEAGGLKNPFLNPATSKFDFGYYLESNNMSAPDIVLFYLGANDGYSSLSILNYGEMIDSVRAYGAASGKQIKIFIMHEYLAPMEGFRVSYSYDASLRRDQQSEYYSKLTSAFGGKESEGIYLIPAHVCINGTTDRISSSGVITDVVHLSRLGYAKQADVISSYVYAIFALK